MIQSSTMAPFQGTFAGTTGTAPTDSVVEIGLLLPAAWADGLLEMSKRRGQSIGQILRGLIDRALVDDGTSPLS